MATATIGLAERMGFEPMDGARRLRLSKPLPSASRPHLHLAPAAGFEPAASKVGASRALRLRHAGKMAPQAGLEPATFRFVAGRSHPLSYWGMTLAPLAGFEPAASSFGNSRAVRLRHKGMLVGSRGLEPRSTRLRAGSSGIELRTQNWQPRQDSNLRIPESKSGAFGRLATGLCWCSGRDLNPRHPT